MTRNMTQSAKRKPKRAPKKFGRGGQITLTALSLLGLLSGWNIIGNLDAQSTATASTQPISSPPQQPVSQNNTAPSIAPLPTLVPIPTLTIPNGGSAVVQTQSAAVDTSTGLFADVPVLPTLAPLPPMPELSAPPPMPTIQQGWQPARSGGS